MRSTPLSGDHPRPIPSRRGTTFAIALWACAYVLSRLLVLATEAEAIYSQDELYNGAAAIEIAAGRGLPLPLMAHAAYCGGPVLLALVAPTMFAVFGHSLFSLRVPSLLVSTATVILWLLIIRKLFGQRAMKATGFLFVLSPPFYSLLTVIAWANHTESNLFSTLTLFCLVALYGRRGGLRDDVDVTPRRAAFLAATMGAATTLGLFFSLASLAMSAMTFVAWSLLGRRRLVGVAGLAYGVGGLIGAVPVVFLNLAWRSRGVLGLMSFTRPGSSQLVRRLVSLIAIDSRYYLAPHLGLPRVMEAIGWVGAIVAASYLAWKALQRLRREPGVPGELLLILPIAAFSAAFALSSFPVGPRSMGFMAYRYLVIPTPWVLATIAVAVSRLSPRVAWFLLVALTLPQGVRTLQQLPRAGSYVLQQRPSSYFAYAIKLFETNDYDLERTLPYILSIEDPVDRSAALAGLGQRHATHHLTRHGGRAAAALIDYVRAVLPGAADLRPVFAERLAFIETLPGRLALTRVEFAALGQVLDQVDGHGELGPIAAVGVLALDRDPAQVAASFDDLATMVPDRLRGDVMRGIGMVAARRACEGRSGSLMVPDHPAQRGHFLRGFGFEVARYRLLAHNVIPAAGCRLGGADVSDGASLRVGAEQLLRLFEPEDSARRALLARLAGLAAPVG